MTSSYQFQWRYDHWKKSPEALDPYEKNIFVEVYKTSVGLIRQRYYSVILTHAQTGVTFREEEISQADIPGLCERSLSSPDTKWSLRVWVFRVRSAEVSTNELSDL